MGRDDDGQLWRGFRIIAYGSAQLSVPADEAWVAGRVAHVVYAAALLEIKVG